MERDVGLVRLVVNPKSTPEVRLGTIGCSSPLFARLYSCFVPSSEHLHQVVVGHIHEKHSAVERRLGRIEAMLEELAREIRGGGGEGGP